MGKVKDCALSFTLYAKGEKMNQDERIRELENQLAEANKVIDVIDALITCKGRYHTAQWYQKMVSAFDEYKKKLT